MKINPNTATYNQPGSELKNFLDTRETARLLDLKPGTLEVWRVQGKGPAFVKFGRAVRYRKSDLDAWIEAQTRQHTSQAA